MSPTSLPIVAMRSLISSIFCFFGCLVPARTFDPKTVSKRDQNSEASCSVPCSSKVMLTRVICRPRCSARSGKLRALTVTTKTRLEALPDIPTVAETVPGYDASGWLRVGAPTGTSTEIIHWLNANINAVLTGAKTKLRLADIGVVILPMAPANYRKFIAADVEKWAKVIKFAKIKPV